MPKQEFTEEQLDNLMELACKLDLAKQLELATKVARVKLECRIESMVSCPEEGQVTIKLPNGSSVCVKRSLIYKADTEKIQGVFTMYNSACVPEQLPCPLKSSTKVELDKDGYAWYRKNHPDLHKIIAEHVTVKPAKTSITRK